MIQGFCQKIFIFNKRTCHKNLILTRLVPLMIYIASTIVILREEHVRFRAICAQQKSSRERKHNQQTTGLQ